MRRFTLMIVAAALLSGCGPKKTADETGRPAGVDLKVERGNRTLQLAWKAHTGGLIAGYNIYVSETPLAGKYSDAEFASKVKPFNTTPFPGDEERDDGIEHFEARGLDNGVKYFVSVRTVYPDRSLSPSSREIEVVCNPEGEIELPIRYRSDEDGFSFARGVIVPAADKDNDLYYFSKDGVDYLASPSRLDGFLRSTNFSVLASDKEPSKQWAVADLNNQTLYTDRLQIKESDWVIVRTADNDYALLHVVDFAGEGEQRKVTLYYSYSNVINKQLFF